MQIECEPQEPCKLIDCPPGLFQFNETIGFKSECFQGNPVEMEVFVVESGESFWGGTEFTDDRAELIVQPLDMSK